MLMQVKKMSGIIIGIRPHGEFDRVVSLFSNEYGLIRIIAKGVRKITSRRGFHLDVLSFVKMEIEKSIKGKISYLREVSTLKTFSGIKRDPESFAAGCLIASFLSRIIPEETPQTALLTITHKTLESLNARKDPKLTLFRYFLKATRLLGHLPPALSGENLRKELKSALDALDPHFILKARRTLGVFSN